MTAHLVDSEVFGHSWATDEVRGMFTDEGRTAGWLAVLAALAAAQADVGIVPRRAADAIATGVDGLRLDLAAVARLTRESGHSTHGLIAVLRERLPPEAAAWVYYGATVQDLTDTWTSTAMRAMHDICLRDLARAEHAALALARRHRRTVMVGRTHGQPGSLTTFGLKAAGWAGELRRAQARVEQARPRLEVVQLGGALGTLEFFGDRAVPLMEAFAARLGLGAPELPWVNSRDRVAEFVANLGIAASSLGRVGNEVYQLQRPEIGEVREGSTEGAVGSITMPHKRNPERSEHLVTLARLVANRSSLAIDGMVHEHERDGRAWKAEWLVVPEVCLLTATSLALGVELLGGLEVDAARMARTIDEQRGYVFSERVMRVLADRVGKHDAHQAVYDATMAGLADGLAFDEALARHPVVATELTREEIAACVDPTAPIASIDQLLDRALGAEGPAGGAP